jgi:hypothetical protein
VNRTPSPDDAPLADALRACADGFYGSSPMHITCRLLVGMLRGSCVNVG